MSCDANIVVGLNIQCGLVRLTAGIAISTRWVKFCYARIINRASFQCVLGKQYVDIVIGPNV
jgi:hypothetical protein